MKEFFAHISGIQYMATGALLVFFTLFVMILVRVIRIDKKKAERYRRIPLEPDQPNP